MKCGRHNGNWSDYPFPQKDKAPCPRFDCILQMLPFNTRIKLYKATKYEGMISVEYIGVFNPYEINDKRYTTQYVLKIIPVEQFTLNVYLYKAGALSCD